MLTIGNKKEEVSLYFHIPFCTRKCDYCHFYVLPDHENLKQQLLDGFKLEWEQMLPLLKNKSIKTIYFGGGTPSLFGPERIHAVLSMIQATVPFADHSIEITLEANPENIEPDLMKDYAQAGINRVSIGIQTLDHDLLHLLGRLHSPNKALQAVNTTFLAGIENISIDLMYDLPNQTLHHWDKTLEKIEDLPISHLSLYNLTIEPHTLFFKRQEELKRLIPDEEASLKMYEKAIERLEKMGLQQYEISAFAKEGFFSKHNTGYWTGRQFLGFGPSAFSYWDGSRFRNVSHLGKYVEALKAGRSPIDFREQLDPEAHRRELLVIQLRLKCGVDLNRFEEQNGPLDAITVSTIQQLIKEGYLDSHQKNLGLTKKGILFYDTVAAELI
jgi:oxygen-independent coproporphyrinogen III oxidase